MNKRDLFSIALKFLALLLFINCFGNTIQFILQLTAPVSNQPSLYNFSTYGNPIRILVIFLYGGVGYFFFTNSDKVAKKVITETNGGNVTEETVLQIVIAYQAISGIIYSTINLINLIFYLLPVLNTGYLPSVISGIMQKTTIYLLELIISVLLLRYYKRITRFLLLKIPAKFWVK